MDLDVANDGGFQFAGAAVDTAPNLFLGQHSEPALHQVDPGGPSRREVEMKARMLSQPAANPRGFVRAVVVQDEVGLKGGGHRHLDLIQELAELNGPMATMALPQDGAALHIQ